MNLIFSFLIALTLFPAPQAPYKPPRTSDGKPDFSGVWRGAPTGQRGAPPPPQPSSGPPLATFRNIGSTFKDGLPLTPWAADLLKKRMADNSKDNPEAHCLPMGIMQFHTQGAPRKFVQTPGLLIILYEASSGIRQIFTDGRPLSLFAAGGVGGNRRSAGTREPVACAAALADDVAGAGAHDRGARQRLSRLPVAKARTALCL